ncbi:MAG: PilZ domain-containing protein [Proteobacteria bacterium]|nr:PilZ domain-containing protein [Pseudomonadota bacterium]
MTSHKKKNTIIIYTTPHYMALFDLGRLKTKIVTLPLQEMVKQFMENGLENDICIMPFVSQYKNLLSTFRSKHLTGPVIFLSDEPVDASILYDVHKLGALLMDIRNQKQDFFRLFILFLLKNQQAISHVIEEKKSATESEKFTETLHQTYYQKPLIKDAAPAPEKEPAPLSKEKDIRAVLAEALEQPEVLPFDMLYDEKALYDSNFSFNFDVVIQKEKRQVSFSCMAKLHSIQVISPSTQKRVVYFHQFHPDFSIKLLRRRIMQVTREDIAKALTLKGASSHQAQSIECIFSLDNLNRTCFMLPSAKKDDDKIGFIPISDAFIQSRQYFRIEPSVENPISAMVASIFSPSREVKLVDISERGISFFSEFLFKKNSEISVFLTWEHTKIVCQGITRFSVGDEKTGKNKIGVELYLHQDECARLRKYVFNCQIDIMNALREDYT